MPPWVDDTSVSRSESLGAAGNNVTRLPACAVDFELSSDAGLRLPGDRRTPLGTAVLGHLGKSNWALTGSGRGADGVVAAALVRPGVRVLTNEAYITARWWIERFGGIVEPFDEHAAGDDIAFVLMTLPRAQLGPSSGSPAPFDQLARVRRWIDRHSPPIPLVVDGARLWENAVATGTSASELVALADIVVLSAGKDLGSGRGGLVAANDRWWPLLEPMVETLEGPDGGLDAAARAEIEHGFAEVADGTRRRLADRMGLVDRLKRRGLPRLWHGCGSLYLDATEWLPDVDDDELPGQTLLNLAYLLFGWRGIATAAGEQGPPVVRLAIRDAADRIESALPRLAETAGGVRSGFRALPADRAAPFLRPATPSRPADWPPALSIHRPRQTVEWLVGRTPTGLGLERAIAEALAWLGHQPTGDVDPAIAGLLQILGTGPRPVPTDAIVTIGSAETSDGPTIRHLRMANGRSDDVAADPDLDDPPDVSWSRDPNGGTISVRASSALAARLDGASLFTLGSWLRPS